MSDQNAQQSDPWRQITKLDPAGGLAFVLARVGNTTVVAIHPTTGKVQTMWLDRNTLDAVAAWADKQNRLGFNLYFAANEPVAGLSKKPTKQQIASIRCVFADIDAKNGRSLPGALAAVLKLPQPDHIIFSGGGYQPLWVLQIPVAATPENVNKAEAIGERIAKIADGDAVQNVDRILRLPFTVNYPNKTKEQAGRTPVLSGLVAMGEAA